MITVDSIYKYVFKYIDTYPIWKVGNKNFTIYPQGMTDCICANPMTTNISFRVVQETFKRKPTLNQLKIASKKAKDFLFKQFKDLLKYQETICPEDNCIEIDITIKYR